MNSLNIKVMRELEDWCKYLKKAKNDDYASYKKKITKLAPKDQPLNTVIVECLAEMLQQQNKFYNYNRDTQNNDDLKAFKRLLLILLEHKDISPQNNEFLQNLIVKDLQQGIQQYLNSLKNQPNINLVKINELWFEYFYIEQRKFWSYVQNDRISDQKLILFYQLTRLNEDINTSNSFYLEYIRLLQTLKWSKSLPPQVSYNIKDDMIQKVAYQNCLFLHPRLIEDITRQIFILELYLRARFASQFKLTFQLFGSLRNRTTIISQTDGDISIFIKSLNQHHSLLVLLALQEYMKTQLQKNKTGLNGLRNAYLKKHRIPYLKLVYLEPFHNQTTFSGSNFQLQTVDLLINNYYGVKNSSILAKYTRNKHVMKLCCLTKLWAKNSKLINSQDPRGRLSSYGLNLMTIYYLIRTGQASYVEKINDYNFVISKPPRIKKNLYENLLGFFEFYSDQSVFFKDKQVVCIMKSACNKSYYDPWILINMYDFIDSTNPGRMKLEGRVDFFRFVARAIQVLKNGHASRISTIFTSRS